MRALRLLRGALFADLRVDVDTASHPLPPLLEGPLASSLPPRASLWSMVLQVPPLPPTPAWPPMARLALAATLPSPLNPTPPRRRGRGEPEPAVAGFFKD